MKLRMGATLQNGKYQLNQILGRESLGATYSATQILLQQPVVIKTLDPSLQITQSFPQLKARFTEETRLLARCQHPSLVRVLDFFEEEQIPFLVMDYIPGQTLYDRVSTPGAPPLAEAEAIHYMRQIASALSATHRIGLVHHNIRPEAIIRRQGTNLGVLVGFGLAHEVALPTLLQDNPFSPPEPEWQSENRFTIDLYSLAATFYYLLSGQAPTSVLSLDQHSWSPATKQAIFRGLTRDSQWQVKTVEEWLRLLPNTTLPLISANTLSHAPISANGTPFNGHSFPPMSAETLPPMPAENPTLPEIPIKAPIAAKTPTANPVLANATKIAAPVQAAIAAPSRLPKFLMFAIVTAGTLGLGFGAALRISAAKAPGTSILHPVQSFGEKDWKGTLAPTENLTDTPKESPTDAKSSKSQQRFVDPEVDRPTYTPTPRTRIQEPEYIAPIQPRSPRSQIDPIPSTPIRPKPVKPAPEPPIDIAPEPVLPNPVEPVTPPLTPPDPITPPGTTTPIKPSTREVDPTPPASRSNVGE
ncbi:MAG: protein kinase [Leptolyngbya sp. Prado105]|jgi:serine/threonine-protein kinase|nr:protein kinase [Leptolyngbya sp. Prado105]